MAEEVTPHRRRPRYRGKSPRQFHEKYKEHDPARDPATFAKVLASGKTPAGTHRPIMVAEILDVLAPQPGEVAVDCTLGYGGHAAALLTRLLPGGRLIGLDVDTSELPKSERRLRDLGFGPATFTAHPRNFAGLPQLLAAENISGADCILADLGTSSMQLDDPSRGFSMKSDGPLDMRMNPARGRPASALLETISPEALAELLVANADEPHASQVANAVARRSWPGTLTLVKAIEGALRNSPEAARAGAVRRVFQALRIAVNDEFSALDAFLRTLPTCLNAGGRVCILTFHSGEDRRVKKAFEIGLRAGVYSEVSPEPLRPGAAERHANPRSTSSKLRWARRTGV